MSVAAFAQRLGVSVPTLYLWRRKLGSALPRAELPAKLVEVTVTRPSTIAADAMVVRLCSGRRCIDVPYGFDDNELRRLIATVESC